MRPATATTLTGRQRRITLRDVSMLEVGGVQSPETPAQLAVAQASLRLVPHRLLLAALDQADALSAVAPRMRGDSLEGVRYASGADPRRFTSIAHGGLVAVETITESRFRRSPHHDHRHPWTPTGASRSRVRSCHVNGAPPRKPMLFTPARRGAHDSLFAIPFDRRARAPSRAGDAYCRHLGGARPWRLARRGEHTSHAGGGATARPCIDRGAAEPSAYVGAVRHAKVALREQAGTGGGEHASPLGSFRWATRNDGTWHSVIPMCARTSCVVLERAQDRRADALTRLRRLPYIAACATP